MLTFGFSFGMVSLPVTQGYLTGYPLTAQEYFRKMCFSETPIFRRKFGVFGGFPTSANEEI
jgi:hypothetical protein